MEELSSTNKRLVEILVENQWIYNFQVTRFFIEEPWNSLPSEWGNELLKLTTEDLNSLPFGFIQDDWPESLRKFIYTATELVLPRTLSEEIQPCALTSEVKRGMNPKKQHEVRHMAALVSNMAAKTGCDVVIDVGSGLGYLGHVLSTVYGLKVIGLESKTSHTSGADKRLFLEKNENIMNVTFEMDDSEDSISNLKTLIGSCLEKFKKAERDKVLDQVNVSSTASEVHSLNTTDRNCNENEHIGAPKSNTLNMHTSDCERTQNMESETNPRDEGNDIVASKVFHHSECSVPSKTNQYPRKSADVTGSGVGSSELDTCLLIGLHCCGDLTPAMLKVYSEVTFVKGLCCVSCCYHRMTKCGTKYVHFPMSKDAEATMSKFDLRPTVPFLRLAAQETRSRWKTLSEDSHHSHTKAVAYRALLEICAYKENTECNKLFRRIATEKDFSDFESYVDKILTRCEFTSRQGKESIKDNLNFLYEEYKGKFPYIEVITVLQVILQPLIERLIIQDRAVWLLENGQNAHLMPVFDDVISPRNVALCSTKIH
ncbi:probable methyltransferase-like protein 25 [Saccostrea echinata]|uniref:probable methyltransferase-like protein 25 n=1 Tax=Saccostrea echinata TaxID=191078 RepID=UPI002A803298|nr:probable methyltransferase-like protein 25 [Saccostrea echinata]